MNEETIKFPKIDKVTRQDKVTPIYGTIKGGIQFFASVQILVLSNLISIHVMYLQD